MMTEEQVREGFGFDIPLTMVGDTSPRRIGPARFTWEDGATFVVAEYARHRTEVFTVARGTRFTVMLGTVEVKQLEWTAEPTLLTYFDRLTVRSDLTVDDFR